MITSNYNLASVEDPEIELEKAIAKKNKKIKPLKNFLEPKNKSVLDNPFAKEIEGDLTQKLSSDYGKDEDANGEPKETTGQKMMGAATGALSMAGTLMSKQGPYTQKENAVNTLNLAVQGAKVGSEFGALGTGIGAGVGLLAGIVSGAGDAKRIQNKKNKEQEEAYALATDDRRKAQLLEEAKSSVDKSKSLLEAQMGILKGNYGNSKIG